MKRKRIILAGTLAFTLLWTAGAGPSMAAVSSIGSNGEILVDGSPFFPIMMWLQSSFRIETQKELGLNTWVGNGGGGTSAEYLAVCQANGVYCVMDPGDMSVQDHPSLLGWIFGDEPDLESNQVEPAEVLDDYAMIKEADADHLTFLTLTAGFYSEMSIPDWMGGSRDRYDDYCSATDVVGFDIYPVYGWCRPDWLTMVADAQEELVTLYAGGSPTYQWIECVRTSSQWCELDERGEDDGPYASEVRNEVWQAIVHGAKAIGYFTHSWECPGYTQFCLSAEQEEELVRTNGQITDLTEQILAPAYGGAVSLDATDGGRLDMMAREQGELVYVFAVNTERSAQHASFTVEGMVPNSQVQVFDEDRSLTAAGTTFEDDFDELGVHVYVVRLAEPGEDEAIPEPVDDADGAPDGPGPEPPDASVDTIVDGPVPDAAEEGDGGDGGGGCGCEVAA